MAIETLVEGNKYSTTSLQKAVIDRLAKDSRILQKLQFESLLGNSLTYNTVTTRSTAAFFAVGGTWTESTPVLTQATVTLKVLGGDADVDNFIKSTRSNQIDITGTVLNDKVLSVKEKFTDTFYYGDATANELEFSGLHVLMTSTTYNTVHAGSSTGTALSMYKVREASDLITGWDSAKRYIAMSKQMRRRISVYLDSIGSAFPRGVNDWGNPVEYYDGAEIIVDDHIVDTETAASGAYSAKTGGANTSLFILIFDPQAVCGVQGSKGVETIPLGDLETKDATRYRIRWYCGLKFENLRSAAKVDGIIAGSDVTA